MRSGGYFLQVEAREEYDAYRKMGETWSVPAVAYVGRTLLRADDPTRKVTATARKPKGTDFVLYLGSGYGDTGEGTTFYSLDPLTGDVITSVDVDEYAASAHPELVRSGMAYTNAIVANPIVFNVSRYVWSPEGVPSPNVAAAPAGRVYVADLYGRFWKFLVAAPDIPIPGADLGADQPVATAGSMLGLPPNDPITLSPTLSLKGEGVFEMTFGKEQALELLRRLVAARAALASA